MPWRTPSNRTAFDRGRRRKRWKPRCCSMPTSWMPSARSAWRAPSLLAHIAGRSCGASCRPITSIRPDGADPRQHTAVHEFHVKLSKIKDRMFTATGKQIAAERHAFMVRFYEQLDREVRGMRRASHRGRAVTTPRPPRHINFLKIVYALAGLFVFILALQLMKAGARQLAPVLEEPGAVADAAAGPGTRLAGRVPGVERFARRRRGAGPVQRRRDHANCKRS